MKTKLSINSQVLKSLALFLLFSLFSLNSFSQVSSNSPCGDPAGSEWVVSGTTCTLPPNPGNFQVLGSYTGYWTGADGSCASAGASLDAWGWFDATSTLTTITYRPYGPNATLHLFDAGPSGAPAACNVNAVPVACANAAGNNGPETITYATIVGNRYRIRVQRVPNGGMNGSLCVYNAPPPPPGNDLCANATTLVCGSNLPSETTNYASDIPSAAATSCVIGSVGVWYTFTGDGQQWTIASTGTGGFDHEMAVFEGDCTGVTTSIACRDDFFADSTETVTFTTVNGTIYYVYIAYFNNGTQTGDFSITATCAPPPTAPANDDPCGAFPLVVNPDYLCGSFTSGTVNTATNSGVDACGGINGSTPNNDVWFSFVATGTAHSVDLLNVSGGSDMAIGVYGGFPNATGANCVPGTVLANWHACFDDPDPISEIITGLVPGQTYFVQVFTYWGGAAFTTFDVCIGSPPPPPANDDPCGSIALTVNPNLACGVTTSGTVLSALDTGVNPCIGDSNDDVWFDFVATSSSHVVQLLNIAGSATDLNHAVYGPFPNSNWPSCNPGTVAPAVLTCSDLNTSITGGLIPGQTYFVQVYTDTSINPQNTTFDVCVGTPPVVPNDEPCGAISLTVNPDFLCGNVTSGTVEWATNSGMTTCAGIDDDDVWFSFVATNTAHSIDLLNISGSTLDMYLGIYGGFPNGTGANCVNGTVDANVAACSDFDSNIFTGFVIGETYFVQVYTFNGNANPTTTFDLCVGTPPPPPPNDDPCGAYNLTVGQACNALTGSVASALPSGINPCVGTADDDVWFSFVASNPNHTITLDNIFGTTTDLNHAVYGGFTAPDCSVAVGDLVNCSNPNSSILTGLTPGDTYFVQVYTNTATIGQTTTFNICVTEPCNNLGPINPIPTVCPLIGAATGSNPFTNIPFDGDPEAYIDCISADVTLEAYTNINLTTDYIVEHIDNTLVPADYSPTGFSTPQVIPNDDVWADAFTSIPFNFCFYGTTYDEFIVGSNGAISFNSSIIPGSGSGWSFNASIPSTAGALTNETIFSVFQDLNPAGSAGVITSWVEGSAPCRTMHISFVNIPLFSDATPSRRFTGKTVLYETTNVIEVYILNKQIENGNISPWNGGNAIVGIQGNAAAGEALSPPCRNGLDDNWATVNEAWRFVPSGAAVTPTAYNWYSTLSGGASLGTSSTLNVTVPDSYFVETTINTCGSVVTLTDEIVVSQSSKTWTGALNTNWYEDANWVPAAIPTPADCVLIPDTSSGSNRYPIADVSNRPIPLPPPSAYALNLTVAAGASLEVLADTELVVTDWVDLDGTIDIRSTGSLIQVNDGAVNVNNNTGTGSINMERTVGSVGGYDYIYWSTPVESFSVGNVSPGSNYIYEWSPTIPGNGVGNFGDWLPTTEIMQPAKGYIIRNISGTVLPNTPVFSGKPNNGIITRPITRGTYNIASPGGDYPGPGGTLATRYDDNWNLVGNPYPSAISADAFLTRNAAVLGAETAPVLNGTIYLWRHNTAPSNGQADPFYGDFVYNYNPGDYIAYNSSGSTPPGFNGDIAAGQAFFVQMEHGANASSSVVRFDNAMRNETLDNSQFYRSEESSENLASTEKHRIWLDLISPNETANGILVGYIEGATDDLDRLYDAIELSETSARFYSIVGNENLSIQGKALPFDDTDTIPLGIDISQIGNYSIGINTLDGLFLDSSQVIYLEDTYNGIIHDLRVNPYSFNAEVGNYEDRFVLRFNNESLSVDEFNVSGLEILAPNNTYIKVKSGNSSIDTVIVYDLLGRVLVEKNAINDSEISFDTENYAEGTYIVKAVLVDGKQKIQKVIIRNMR